MTLRLHDTLSGETTDFEPIGDAVTLYLCGLTTSDPAHLGHARVWLHTDVLHRWLEYSGYEVRHVENFTDVNEKVLARVGEVGDSEADVGRHYVAEFLDDMRSLRLKRATVYPRVTEHVEEVVAMVETLLEKGYAYESNGSVYFDVTSFEDYGKLSGQQIDELEAQGPEDERSEKRHPADFALWKADGVGPEEIVEHQHEEAADPEDACETALTWDSPWGEGRPGWHIECSAMSTTHLANTFDIHVAGEDLVFPHNENEIAQAEAATGQPLTNHWLHVGLLETGDEKMSSSLGNFYTVEEGIEKFGADVVRTFLLSATYSEKQAYSEAAIEEAQERFERLERGYERAVAVADSPDSKTKVRDDSLRSAVATAREEFGRAMDDDLNTREAFAALLELTSAVHEHLDSYDDADYQGLRSAIEAYDKLGGGVLGLRFGATEAGDVTIAEELVELVLEVREQQRAAGNYEQADELRADLESIGVEVQDTDEGPEFRL
ncbi:cysteinyl-tRNA synthetase [Salinarchaeum sp. Harcht-Bsk1]|uniref:cysteine--tRNA ligase n=1 Tax=Salinarchaeum sp. Harcht-Bsk1 TaxID=1333523 RepID=UPI00034247F2|nr:cysteine--tRNA ligase [Salinarchaeum sp. Harcht-Bsk1]AGN02967.1 cysteinyl-tRNA synthetase [Salinarchaeum sp. Harcht-Bsk1]